MMSQVSTTGRAIHGTTPTARAGETQRSSSTPASMALAMGPGMPSTARKSGRHNPASMMSRPEVMKAPTAAAKPPLGARLATSRAAPGVDQAMATGMRVRKLNQAPSAPMEKVMMVSPEAAWAGVAPMAR